MGKFDRKVSKHEPEAPNSIKILKKKSNSALAALMNNPKGERERNMKILGYLNKSYEVKAASKADAHFNVDKMVNKKIRKEEKHRKREKAE